MNFDKNRCIDSLATALNSTSQWRTGKFQSFVSDSRNERAAKRLSELAGQATELSDDDWLALKPHFNPSSDAWMQATSLAARQVGFNRHPKDFPAFVGNLTGILAQPVVV